MMNGRIIYGNGAVLEIRDGNIFGGVPCPIPDGRIHVTPAERPWHEMDLVETAAELAANVGED